MGIQDKQARKLTDLAQAHVGDPVEMAAIFLRKGETASRTSFDRGRSLGKWADAMQNAPDFGPQTLIALTEDSMHLFKAKGGFSWKLKEPLGQWAYGSFQAEDAGTERLTRLLTLTFLDGREVKLEVQVSGAQKWQGTVLDALVQRSGAALAEGV